MSTEVWTCLNLFSNDREFNLSSFGTGLSQFGPEMKELWILWLSEGHFGHFRYQPKLECVWICSQMIENSIWVHLELVWVDLDLKQISYGQKGLKMTYL